MNLSRKMLWKSIKIALWIHALLSVFFIIGSVINGEGDLIDNLRYGIYFSFLFLQFLPFTFLAIMVMLVIVKLYRRNKENGF
jgi:hypothetical protein